VIRNVNEMVNNISFAFLRLTLVLEHLRTWVYAAKLTVVDDESASKTRVTCSYWLETLRSLRWSAT